MIISMLRDFILCLKVSNICCSIQLKIEKWQFIIITSCDLSNEFLQSNSEFSYDDVCYSYGFAWCS